MILILLIYVRAFLYKISSKFKKLKVNFKDKTRFMIKISKTEFINSALEDENNGTEERETSDKEYLSDFTKLQPYICEEKNHQIQMKTRTGNTLWCSCGKYGYPCRKHLLLGLIRNS